VIVSLAKQKTRSTVERSRGGADVFVKQDEESGEITFYMKGADVVMHNVVQYNDWMDEEVS